MLCICELCGVCCHVVCDEGVWVRAESGEQHTMRAYTKKNLSTKCSPPDCSLDLLAIDQSINIINYQTYISKIWLVDAPECRSRLETTDRNICPTCPRQSAFWTDSLNSRTFICIYICFVLRVFIRMMLMWNVID